nr:hypothetical protein [Micromonospora sp. DSM 115978]
MIYRAKRVWWADRRTGLLVVGTVVGAAALGVLLSAVLVACENAAGQNGRRADGSAGAAALRGAAAGTNPSGTPTASAGTVSGDGSTGGAGSPSGDGSTGGDGPTGGDGSTGGDQSGGDGAPTGPDQPDPDVAPASEDCIGYAPEALAVEAVGDAWRVRSGGAALKLFDTKADAEDGVKVARRWRQMCFIGRGNDRPDRYRYIVTYWQQPSGLPLGLAPSFAHCVAYPKDELKVYGPGGDGWSLRAGAVPLLFLDTAADAERARLVAAGHRQLCHIGHGNDRPDPARYVTQHWRA